MEFHQASWRWLWGAFCFASPSGWFWLRPACSRAFRAASRPRVSDCRGCCDCGELDPLAFGLGALKPSRLVPAKSISQSHPWLGSLGGGETSDIEGVRGGSQSAASTDPGTVDALRSGLTPSNLASEAASHVGIADLSWGGAFDYASKRHPVRPQSSAWASHYGRYLRPKPRQRDSASDCDGASEGMIHSIVSPRRKCFGSEPKQNGESLLTSRNRKSQRERQCFPTKSAKNWRRYRPHTGRD